MACCKSGGWGATGYSTPEYDERYDAQQVATTVEGRQQIAADMQGIVYDDVPEVVLYYNNGLEAYRSDRWEGIDDDEAVRRRSKIPAGVETKQREIASPVCYLASDRANTLTGEVIVIDGGLAAQQAPR